MSDTILDGWIHVILRDGWPNARIDAVARVAACNISAVAAVAPDRWAALQRFAARAERSAIAEAASDPGESVRNRLFALLMALFDALHDDRDLVRALDSAARRDPALGLFALTVLTPTLRRLAEAAGVDAGGLIGPLRIAALTALYLQVGRVFIADDSADLAPTMKALDTALARAERLAQFRPRFPAGGVTVPPEAPESSAGRLLE